MNKQRTAFWAMAALTALSYALLIPPILSDAPPNEYYPNLLKNARIRRIPARALPDYRLDSDSDGLTDYDEGVKYLTDRYKADSDGDGLDDGVWEERSEYTRTYRAVVDLRPPYSLADMNDFYQDARRLGRSPAGGASDGASDGTDRFEVILYPDAKEKLAPAPYAPVDNAYTAPSFAKDYDDAMKEKVRGLTSFSLTDLEALVILQNHFNSFSYEDLSEDLGYTTGMPLQFQYYSDGAGGYTQIFGGLPTTYPMDELLARQFFASGMFARTVRGACSSSATLRGALFRAAGLEERTVFTVPLFYSLVADGTIVDVASIPAGSLLGQDDGHGTIADHFFNEVRIGGRWIRVDSNLIDTGVYGPRVKLMVLHDQADVSWEYWESRRYFSERPYAYVSIEEHSGTHRD